MADQNVWAITGRLTKDAEYRMLASGKGLLTFNVAVNTGWGEYKKTTFAKVQQWGDRGAKLAPYLTKGKLIATAGTLTVSSWQGRDGVEHTDLVLDTNSIQLLGGGDEPLAKEPEKEEAPAVEPIEEVPF